MYLLAWCTVGNTQYLCIHMINDIHVLIERVCMWPNLCCALPARALSSWFDLFLTARPKWPSSLLPAHRIWSVTPLYNLIGFVMPYCAGSLSNIGNFLPMCSMFHYLLNWGVTRQFTAKTNVPLSTITVTLFFLWSMMGKRSVIIRSVLWDMYRRNKRER